MTMPNPFPINGNQPQPLPRQPIGPLVQPAGLSTTVAVAELPIPGEHGVRIEKRVVLIIESANGTWSFFLDDKHADALSTQLADNARLARSGLIVPNPGAMLGPPGGAA